jgi:hypothetical protein
MNISTIVVSQTEALAKVEQYKSITGKRRLKEDDKLQQLYTAVAKRGARVLNLLGAFQQTGLNELHQPRLAIARADWKAVTCVTYRQLGQQNFGVRFGKTWQTTTRSIKLPLNVPNTQLFRESALHTPVPHVPPECRPKFNLGNYHILFEVEKWNVYPKDPFLLRHIAGLLYVVEAEWELTDLETSLLASFQEAV